MKYFKLNDTDSVIAETPESALSKFKELFSIKIDENYNEEKFKAEHDINIIEVDINEAKVFDGDSKDDELITVAEYIKRHPKLESPHFSSEF